MKYDAMARQVYRYNHKFENGMDAKRLEHAKLCLVNFNIILKLFRSVT